MQRIYPRLAAALVLALVALALSAPLAGAVGTDWDADGVRNALDNCLKQANPDQRDMDGDGKGDVCDSDRDGDGQQNASDPCPDDALNACVTPPPPPPPDPDGIALGAHITNGGAFPYDPSALDRYNTLVGQPAKIAMWYVPWANAGYNTYVPAHVDAAIARGAVPMITWEPHDWNGGVNQPNYQLSDINSGTYDAYIRQFARDVSAHGKPIYLRFAHEMNGTFYSWHPRVNGNASGGAEYIAAWKRVHGIFAQEGATNVTWVWSPNVEYQGTTPVAQMYPGDAYVDWLGIDGYNWGTINGGSWQSFDSVFASTYANVTAISQKPLMIGEMAAPEEGGDKAAWIRETFLEAIPNRYPRIEAVVWFHRTKETNWGVDSSSASLEAYREVAADPRYQGTLP
jgi:beta-mannanase